VFLSAGGSGTLARVLAVAFFLASLFFVHRSFYGMRIESGMGSTGTGRPAAAKA
jgi:K(+)-stimulated pyrophosphate-energized sodium pump